MTTATIAESFGRRLAEVRRRAGLSQVELAEKANLTTRAVQYLERGERTAKIDTLLALATALSVEPNALLLFRWR